MGVLAYELMMGGATPFYNECTKQTEKLIQQVGGLVGAGCSAGWQLSWRWDCVSVDTRCSLALLPNPFVSPSSLPRPLPAPLAVRPAAHPLPAPPDVQPLGRLCAHHPGARPSQAPNRRPAADTQLDPAA